MGAFDPLAHVTSFSGTRWTNHVVDLEKDGYDDIIFESSGDLTILRGGPSGFTAEEEYEVVAGSGDHTLGIGDVNGDGHLDVVVGYSQDPWFSLLLGAASGDLQSRIDFPVVRSPYVAVSDVNNDGKDDIVVHDTGYERLQFYLQQPDGSLAPSPDYPFAPLATSFAEYVPGDFNGDGLVDFFAWLREFDVGYAAFIMQESPGVWGDPILIPRFGEVTFVKDEWYPGSVLVEDLDNDGVDDVVANAFSTGTPIDSETLVFWQSRDGVNVDPELLPFDCYQANHAVDIDGDGLLELACDAVPATRLLVQYEPRHFFVNNYETHGDDGRNPVLGNFIGNDEIDLATRPSPEQHLYRGLAPGFVVDNPGTISGDALFNGAPAVGLCVKAMAALDGSVMANDVVEASGHYQLTVPAGVYVIAYEDCRELPLDPPGYSYATQIYSVYMKSHYAVGPSEHVKLNISVRDYWDRPGVAVDDLSRDALEEIHVANLIWDDATAWYWVVGDDYTARDGSFLLRGLQAVELLLFEDPRNVYGPHTGFLQSNSYADTGIWGLTDPAMRDIRDSQFVADILWLRSEGVTKGCNPPNNDHFCPDDYVTRGQMAAFLGRFLSLTDGKAIRFIDDDDSIFEADIERLANAEITKGCNPPANDRFCPDQFATRGQMAAFLARALGLPAASGDVFGDDDGSVFEQDIERLASAGITKGCTPPANDRFCPNQPVTRGQMAAFLHRADTFR